MVDYFDDSPDAVPAFTDYESIEHIDEQILEAQIALGEVSCDGHSPLVGARLAQRLGQDFVMMAMSADQDIVARIEEITA